MIVKHLFIDNIEEIKEPIAICLGYFDGLHLGHKKIISNAIQNSGLPIGILTFDVPVSSFINNGKSNEVLTSLDDRFRILSHDDIKYYFVFHLSKEFLALSPIEFIKKVLLKLNVKEVFVGEDYRFGKGHEGNIELLKKYFKVNVSSLVYLDNQKVSTQEIVKLIKEGNIKEASSYLGRHYQVMGVIVEGQHLGMKLGFPTANIKLSTNYVIPKYGVYKTIAFISGIPHISLTNVGVHPTVNEREEAIIETHIPNYTSDDYNKTIYLEFVEFIRPEMKFESLSDLVLQIEKDMKSL